MMIQMKRVMLVLPIVFFSLQIFPLPYTAGFQLEGPLITKGYDICQATERWEKLTNQNFPLTLVNWQLVTNPGSSDKYMDKHVIGEVKNNSRKEFSEVKVEFTVYDGDGNQIAIVLSNRYDFKPGDIWKFEIPVTSDVARATFNGFYVPLKE